LECQFHFLQKLITKYFTNLIMLKGATDRGQRLFLLKCALYCRWKQGIGETTIQQIFFNAGMNHLSPQECAELFLEIPDDNMIQISSKVEPFTTGNVFNLDTDILIAVKSSEEQKFLEFIDKRLLRLENHNGLNLPEKRELNDIQQDTNIIRKIQSLISFLRKCPVPLFTY